MPDLTKFNSDRLCSYHEKLIERLIEKPELANEIEKRRKEIIAELERRSKLDDFVRPAEGMLSFYGYHVGSTLGRSEDFRREVLSKIFHEKNLPLVGSLSYVEEWGASSSKKRLNKINNCLLGFLNSKYPGYMDMTRAFREWHADLKWIEDNLKE